MSDVSQIGLGLAFCKMVVEAHGGEICVRNNQPQGAIFEITLAA
jgi:signal transduction histidine kinase